jgi:urease accessory protein
MISLLSDSSKYALEVSLVKLALYLIILTAPDIGWAHGNFAGAGDFGAGLMHPFLDSAAAISLILAALLWTSQNQRWLGMVYLTFILSFAVAAWIGPNPFENGLTVVRLFGLILGALVIWHRNLGLGVLVPTAFAAGVTAYLPFAGDASVFGWLFWLGILLVHLAGFSWMALLMKAHSTSRLVITLKRVIASWLIAINLMLLALALR